MGIFNKYIDSNNSAKFTFKGENAIEFKSTHASVGLINPTPGNTIWIIKIEGFINNELVYSDVMSGLGKIFFNFQFPQQMDVAVATLEIKNPSVFGKIIGWYKTRGFVNINSNGFGFMNNLGELGSFGYTGTATPSNLFDLKKLKKLSYQSKDIIDFDDRFFQGGLPLLEDFALFFPYDGNRANHKEENLKQLDKLKKLSVVFTSITNNGSGELFFDTNFDYPIEDYAFSDTSRTINVIPQSTANLRRVKKITIGGWYSFDLTYPLISGVDNNVLEQIILPSSSIIYQTDVYNLNFPTNIEKLKALKYLNTGSVRGDRGDILFDNFENMFYSKIYNSATNTFTHPSFREYVMTTHLSYQIKIPASKKQNVQDIIDIVDVNGESFKLQVHFDDGTNLNSF